MIDDLLSFVFLALYKVVTNSSFMTFIYFAIGGVGVIGAIQIIKEICLPGKRKGVM